MTSLMTFPDDLPDYPLGDLPDDLPYDLPDDLPGDLRDVTIHRPSTNHRCVPRTDGPHRAGRRSS